MKQRTLQYLTVFSAVLLGVSVFAQEPNISFETQKIDLGDTLFCSGVSYPYFFVYENTGSAPLIVNEVIATCPCLRVEFSSEPLPPAAKDTIRVYFTPTRPSKYTQRLSVFTNSPRNGIQLFAKGNFMKQSAWKSREILNYDEK